MHKSQGPEVNNSSTPAQNGDESKEEAKQPISHNNVANFDSALALKSFNENCSACHQNTGLGLPGVFPPLTEHIANIYNSSGGREYLIHVPLFGIQGPIEVLGKNYNGVMAGRQMVSNEDIALALNHAVTSWGNLEKLNTFSPFLPNEVAKIREKSLSASDVYELRQSRQIP